jgi:hypothetical protein
LAEEKRSAEEKLLENDGFSPSDGEVPWKMRARGGHLG